MRERAVQLNYLEFDHIKDLTEEEQNLMETATDFSKGAYAPYSDFKVGAAVSLGNGKIVGGSNQENAAFPSGLCAERVALFSASAQFPEVKILGIAIYAGINDLKDVLSPCGACRQVMQEYEQRQAKPIKVLLSAPSGKILLFDSTQILLPFAFHLKSLKKH